MKLSVGERGREKDECMPLHKREKVDKYKGRNGKREKKVVRLTRKQKREQN